MTSDLPAWTEFDPGDPLLLASSGPSAGRVVALVAAPEAARVGWAADIALGLARGWRHRTVTADAGLTEPTLHLAAGLPLEEGLSDVLLWGGSLRRVARRMDEGGFVITAGTAVADGAAALADPRWASLCSGFREAGVTFAVLVPSSEAGLGSVLGEADDIVVVAGPDEDVSSLLTSNADRVRAIVGFAVPPLAEVEPADVPDLPEPEPVEVDQPEPGQGAPPAFEPPEEVEELPPPSDPPEIEPEPEEWPPPSDPPEIEPEPEESPSPFDLLEAGPELGEPADEDLERVPSWASEDYSAVAELPTIEEPSTVSVDPSDELDPLDRIAPAPSFEEIVDESEVAAPRSNVRRNILLVVLLLVLAAGAAAAYLGYVEIPGVTPAVDEAVPPATASMAAESPLESAPVQAFSVALGAYQDGSVAADMVRRMSGVVPDALFITVPVSVNGTVVHRVLVGPAADSAGAAELAARVSTAAGVDPASWVARPTPRAFQLGEMSELEAAQRRVEVLVGLGIPAYIFAVDYNDGSVRYRVYAGAYADATEASYLSGLLEERGLSSATLSERTGRLPE